MQLAVSFRSYLVKILIIAVLFYALPVSFSWAGVSSTSGSYILSCLCFFILTIISVAFILGRKYVRFYAIAFVIQVFIGLIHYLILVQPDYFSTSGTPVAGFWHEYQTVFNSIEGLISNRQSHSLLFFDSSEWNGTHPEIWRIISIPFTFLGHKWLNYAPFNVFSSLLASTSLLVVYNYHNNTNSKDDSTKRILLFTSAYFPLFLLNDTLWRDAFGVALMSIGLVLITLSNSLHQKLLSLVALVFCSFILRNVYVGVAGFAFLIKEIDIKKGVLNLLVVPIAVLVIILISQFFQSNTEEGYISLYVNRMSFLALPLKVLMGAIGPFPWTQFSLAFSGRVEYAYQLSDYLLGVFQFGCILAIISNWHLFSLRNPGYMTLMGLGICLAGFVSHSMHIGYIAEGVFFLLPWFFSRIGVQYKKYFSLSFLILFILNLLLFFTGNLGISSLWR